MIRPLSLLVTLAALGAAPTVAQTPAKSKPAAPATHRDLAGTWNGPLETPMGTTSAKLILTRATDWKAQFEIEAGHPVEMSDIRDLQVTATTVSWEQKIMANECRADAKLEVGVLKGTLDCGAYQATFALGRT